MPDPADQTALQTDPTPPKIDEDGMGDDGGAIFKTEAPRSPMEPGGQRPDLKVAPPPQEPQRFQLPADVQQQLEAQGIKSQEEVDRAFREMREASIADREQRRIQAEQEQARQQHARQQAARQQATEAEQQFWKNYEAGLRQAVEAAGPDEDAQYRAAREYEMKTMIGMSSSQAQQTIQQALAERDRQETERARFWNKEENQDVVAVRDYIDNISRQTGAPQQLIVDTFREWQQISEARGLAKPQQVDAMNIPLSNQPAFTPAQLNAMLAQSGQTMSPHNAPGPRPEDQQKINENLWDYLLGPKPEW